MRLYLAGPMRRMAEYNFPAFFAAEAELLTLGHTVHNPARVDAEAGFQWQGTTGSEDLAALGFDLRQALATDMSLVALESDGVCVLPGWEASSGARAEAALAMALGLPVVALRDVPGHELPRLVELELVMTPTVYKELTWTN